MPPNSLPDSGALQKHNLQLELKNLEAQTAGRVLLVLYLRAVWDDAVARMGGGLGIFFAFLAAYFAFVAGHNIALLWVLALLAFLFASYRVWAKERRALLAEQTKNANPDIHGEIKEVYFDHEVSMDKSGPNSAGDFEVFYDFVFTIRVFVKNLGIKTTVEGYRLVLDGAGFVHEGERVALDDYYIRRSGMKEGRIDDIETRNDEPLETSRSGWLRFVVRGVKGGERRPHDIQMKLELDVIDIRETSHRLDMIPQSQWHYDANWATKYIRHLSEL